MSDLTGAPEVLRGIRLEGAPLRLGRAAANVEPAPDTQVLLAEAAQEEALRHARDLALRQAHEQGLRAGHAEGLREGRAEAAEEIRGAVQRAVDEAQAQARAETERVRRIAQHLQAALADLLWGAQDELVALCFETLCRVVAASALQPEFIRAQLGQILAQHGAPGVVLHLHPQDAALLREEPAWTDARVLADAEVALGGCIVKTASGALDARLDTVLDACKAALLAARTNAVRNDPGVEAA